VASYGWDRTFSELVGLYRRLLSEASSAAREMTAPTAPEGAAPRISV
jgi:hypothetical protein